jgi:cbb3-type cytochrome oxidase subunit 3
MCNYIPTIKRYLSLKSIVFLISVASTIPLFNLLYWIFEVSYFGYFGISPELFSRPVFSSNLIDIWIFAILLQPAFMVLIIVMAVILIPVIWINLYAHNNQNVDSDENIGTDKTKHFLTKLVTLLKPAEHLAILGWLLVMLTFFVLLILFVYTSKEGRKLAKMQIEGYSRVDYKCFDGLDDNNIGCYSIDGIDGSNHLVITNNKTHLIYLSQTPSISSKNKAADNPVPFDIHIVEKAPGDVYKITRQYKPYKTSQATKGTD